MLDSQEAAADTARLRVISALFGLPMLVAGLWLLFSPPSHRMTAQHDRPTVRHSDFIAEAHRA